ncbi:MAG TPA: hypothetical protein VFU14_13330 [Acidimicrobiales bacterium]|nr:hypothetical protein [Acidimicrobiales bacterium]
MDEGFTVDMDLVLANLFDEIPPAWRPGPAPSLPLASVITPLRTRHHDELQRLEAVGGARAGDDTVVVAVAVLSRHRDAHGRLHLRRPDVVAAVHRAAFLLEDHGVQPLDGVPVAVAAVLQRESETGLSARADPLEALLEPLRAHFGVGEPPANHVCQCFAPHDPWCPPDHRLLPVRSGHLVHARMPGAVDEMTARAALIAFAEAWCAKRGGAAVAPPALSLLGSFIGSRATGRLWAFGDEERPGRYDALHLDAGGVPYVARPDRRYSTGFRWCEVRPSEVGWPLHGERGRYPTAVA